MYLYDIFKMINEMFNDKHFLNEKVNIEITEFGIEVNNILLIDNEKNIMLFNKFILNN